MDSELEQFRKKFRPDALSIAGGDHWVVSLRPNQKTLGSMVISSRQGTESFSALSAESGPEFTSLLAASERAVKSAYGAVRVNCLGLMMVDPVVHFHIIPRYDSVVERHGVRWFDDDWPSPPQLSHGNNEANNEKLEVIRETLLTHWPKPVSAPFDVTKVISSQDFNKAWMEPTLRHYERANALFEKEFGKSLYAVGGTLLGAIRDGGFISFDKDMDVAFLCDATTPELTRKSFLAVLQRLIEMGEKISIVDRRGRLQPRHAKWWSKDGYYFDMFPAYFDEEGYYCRPTFVRVSMPRSDFLPLQRVPFNNGHIYVPHLSEKKLGLVMGSGWRVPDPKWTKPVFDGVQEMRKALSFRRKEIQAIASHSDENERVKIATALANRKAKKMPREGEAKGATGGVRRVPNSKRTSAMFGRLRKLRRALGKKLG